MTDHEVSGPPPVEAIEAQDASRSKGPRPDGGREVQVPQEARALSMLASVDYCDAFRADIDSGHVLTAEQLARTMLEDPPMLVRAVFKTAWRIMGLRLDSSQPGRSLVGWELRRNEPDTALMAARSPLGFDAEILTMREEKAILVAVFVRLENRLARTIWAGIGPAHKRTARYLLGFGRVAAMRASERSRS